MELEVLINCAKCSTEVCRSGWIDEARENYPVVLRPDVIARATERHLSTECADFAREASRQEGSGYARLAHVPSVPPPIKSTVE